MKPIITINQHIKIFVCNCLSSRSLTEFKKKLLRTRIKTGEKFELNHKEYDIYQISIDRGRLFLSFIELDEYFVILGYHLNNDDVDENNNLIFITGSTSEQIGKINILVNKGIKL